MKTQIDREEDGSGSSKSSVSRSFDMAAADIERLRRRVVELEVENAGLRQDNPKAGNARDAARIIEEIDGTDNGTDPFAAAVKATGMPMVISNPRAPDNPIVFVNEAFCRLTGYARDEILGRNCRFLQGPKTDSGTVARIRAAIESHKPVRVDILNYRKTGETFWNRLLMAPVRDAEGNLAYFFGNQVDVTSEREKVKDLEDHNTALMAAVENRYREQEEIEAQLRELNDTLEQRVEKRTSELRAAEEQLRQSQKMEAVGQLTGGIAHDFNNLLTIMRSSVALLRRPNISEESRRHYIDDISRMVDQAAKVTGQLLAFARRQALKPEVFNAGERLRTIADMLDKVTGTPVRVIVDLPATTCHIMADPSQFDTAVVNMAVNARDAMDRGGTLTLRLIGGAAMSPTHDENGAPGSFVAVSLTDTGKGILPDVMERIFEPFFTTKAQGKGTGLGLSQVYGFAKQSGGEIAVASRVGEGTTFTLYLPEVAAPAPAMGASEPEVLIEGHGFRVLVVEDNQDVGRFTTRGLAEFGYKTVWAENAEEGLIELARDADRFDIVFSDFVMPGMNGIQLGQEIQRLYPHLPVVLTSGYSSVLAQIGASGFELLHKPYSIEDVARVLGEAVIRNRYQRLMSA